VKQFISVINYAFKNPHLLELAIEGEDDKIQNLAHIGKNALIYVLSTEINNLDFRSVKEAHKLGSLLGSRAQ